MNTYPSTRRWLRGQVASVVGRIKSRSSSNAAEALFHLNRSSLTYGNEEWMYEMKAAFINHFINASNYLRWYTLVKQVLECWDCGGTGQDYSDGEGCQKCCGTGIWRSTKLLQMFFEFGNKVYVWHLPLDQVRGLVGPEPTVAEEWRGTKEHQPHPGKFKEAVYLATLHHWLKRAGHDIPKPQTRSLARAWELDRGEDDIPF